MSLDVTYRKNWNKSLRNSIVIHVFLLLIAFLFRFEVNPEEKIEAQYAVTVSFQQVEFKNARSSNSNRSRANAGAQRAKSEAPKKIETPKPAKVPVPTPTPPKPTPQPETSEPTPTEPVISETTTEESDIQAVEEPIDVDEPEPEYIPQESTDPVPVDEPIILNPDLPTLDDIIGDITDDPIEMEAEGIPAEDTGTGDSKSDTPGTADADPSLKDGDGGSGRGDSGSGKGKDDRGNDGDSGAGDGGYGEGEFDASGDGIFGRKVIYRDPSMVRLVSSKSGKLVFKVCINRRGLVSYIEIDELRSTIKDTKILRDGLESMRKYKYEVDFSAPKEQCGQFSVIVDNFQGIRGSSSNR